MLNQASLNWTGELTSVGLAHLYVLSVPLSDARSTGVSENESTDILEGTDLSVTLDGCTDLLRSRGNGELTLDFQTVCSGFPGDRCRARHVLIRRVGAGSNEGNSDLIGPLVLLSDFGELGNGGAKIRSKRSVNVRLELGEVL